MGQYNSPPDIVAVIGGLEKRIAALERTKVVPVGSGAPPANQVDGSLYGDKTGRYLYVVLGGVARRVAVT